jgi:hypothetical protein
LNLDLFFDCLFILSLTLLCLRFLLGWGRTPMFCDLDFEAIHLGLSFTNSIVRTTLSLAQNWKFAMAIVSCRDHDISELPSFGPLFGQRRSAIGVTHNVVLL